MVSLAFFGTDVTEMDSSSVVVPLLTLLLPLELGFESFRDGAVVG